MTPYVELGTIDLIIATALVLMAGLVSVALKLDLEKRLALASVRTVLQLLLIGYILRWVFNLDHPAAVLIVMLIMMTAASQAAVNRSSRKYNRARMLSFLALVVSATITTFTVTGIIIRVDPWFEPQYLIPLLGMVLGNSLNGISLCLDSFLETLKRDRDLIEMDLAHGATRWEAARAPLSDAVRRGMIPIINSMMVVGIVSLPGMMTGQIIAGMEPVEAVKYQIVVMFMIAAATALGAILIALFTYRALFNDRHQLRSERIVGN